MSPEIIVTRKEYREAMVVIRKTLFLNIEEYAGNGGAVFAEGQWTEMKILNTQVKGASCTQNGGGFYLNTSFPSAKIVFRYLYFEKTSAQNMGSSIALEAGDRSTLSIKGLTSTAISSTRRNLIFYVFNQSNSFINISYVTLSGSGSGIWHKGKEANQRYAQMINLSANDEHNRLETTLGNYSCTNYIYNVYKSPVYFNFIYLVNSNSFISLSIFKSLQENWNFAMSSSTVTLINCTMSQMPVRTKVEYHDCVLTENIFFGVHPGVDCPYWTKKYSPKYKFLKTCFGFIMTPQYK